MKLWDRGSGLIAFLPKLALAVMVLGAAVGGNGDGGFLHRVSYHPFGRVTAASASEDTVDCTGGKLAPGDGTKNLEITGACTAGTGLYQYKDVNIFGTKDNPGSLTFEDGGPINFWAKSIIIENHGSLIAGSPADPFVSKLTIHLWGLQQGTQGTHPERYYDAYGVPCRSPDAESMGFSDCGIPKSVWGSNANSDPESCIEDSLPGGVTDCFYKYRPITFDGADPHAFFGYKVLAVSYGGTLHLYGAKGAMYPATPLSASDTGTSWTRLDLTAKPGDAMIVVADPTGKIREQWAKGDKIVVGSTDYLPGHAEELTISGAPTEDTNNSNDTDIPVSPEIKWQHNGQKYQLNQAGISRLGLGFDSIDTRAPVALLTRNITIESDPTLGAENWPVITPACNPKEQDCYFGGDTIFRQGFKSVQVQGVEFYQLGEGGRIGHYPVHFHLVRKVPPDTFVKDSSVWDSMTRWYVLHGAEDVTLQRDVGYKSIGHGYYLEDGTETNNTLDANVGIFARAAIDNDQNPRDIPGILSAPFPEDVDAPCGPDTCPCNDNKTNRCPLPQEQVPYHSDIVHPSVFWIMNGWNNFEYNVADGAGTCGFCYWLLPGYISGPSRHEHWSGYSAEQRGHDRAAMAPLKEFLGNSCSSAMNSFNVVGDTSPCRGVVWDVNTNLPRVKLPEHDPKLVPAVNAAKSRDGQDEKVKNYYPNVDTGGGHFGTRCKGAECATVAKCGAGEARKACMVTVLDHYTTSFNWAQHNVSAIWMRPQWSLLLQSAVTDVQNGGVTFVTGGDYTHSSLVPGNWMLARKSVFVGSTQPGNPWASEAGPFNPDTKLTCATQRDGAPAGGYCLSKPDGISMPLDNFAVNQRLFNIYDGPAYEDDNGFLDITPTVFDCKAANAPKGESGQCAVQQYQYMYANVLGLPKDNNSTPEENECYLPNAAIGWKQPNGFYYPPAFHSRNLFFHNVPIRHYVIEPSFLSGTLFKTNVKEAHKRYCNFNQTMFNNFSDVDRQTELNDDDGSLTGLVDTISVNQDSFFDAPYSTTECKSDISDGVPTDPTKTAAGTANTSPYDYVSTVIFPSCAAEGATIPCNKDGLFWSSDCANNTCFGVPLYRELATGSEKSLNSRLTEIRMGGENFYQRNTLTVNHGVYYMDTTVGKEHQQKLGAGNFTVFQKKHTYDVFLLFAKPSTTQEYQIYVGPGFDKANDLKVIRAKIVTKRIKFDREPWKDRPEGWSAEYKDSILTVTMNMGFPDFLKNYNNQRMDNCSPESFCKWSGNAATGACGCNISDIDYPDQNLINQCNQTTDSICSWSSKDVDCPAGGCYGFSFKLPNDFETGEKLPPPPECFPRDLAWNTPFKPASQDLAGSCFYGTGGLPVPQPDFCSVP